MALLARATGRAAPAARPGARGAASFYGASGSGSGNLERRVSTGQSEAELRGKVGVNRIPFGAGCFPCKLAKAWQSEAELRGKVAATSHS